MKDLQEVSLYIDRFCRYDEEDCSKLPAVLKCLNVKNNRQVHSLEALSNLNVLVYKKMLNSKRACTSKSGTLNFDKTLFSFADGVNSLLLDTVQSSDNDELRLTAMKGLLSFLPYQAKMMSPDPKFPFKNFTDILQSVLGAESSARGLEEALSGMFQHQDTVGRLWPGLEVALSKFPRPLSAHVVGNATVVINSAVSSSEKAEKPLSGFLVSSLNNLGTIVQSVWKNLIDTELSSLPSSVHQSLLLMLIQHIMPIIDRPVLLTDHLVSALNRGGPVALVALQGIFTLIQKHNIEYPNVYGKLYNMFKPEIFTSSYKSRFYYLSDIFLTSTHLSGALVAGFVKRFVRLALVAPPEDAAILLTMTLNLLIRHPTLTLMFHNPNGVKVDADPYDASANDPAASGAEGSSVWEALLLVEHPIPCVSNAAAALLRPPPGTEIPLGPLLDSSSDEIFAKECKKKMKEPPLTFERPSLIFSGNQLPPWSLWSLT